MIKRQCFIFRCGSKFVVHNRTNITKVGLSPRAGFQPVLGSQNKQIQHFTWTVELIVQFLMLPFKGRWWWGRVSVQEAHCWEYCGLHPDLALAM